jgi:hypothetical protein
LRYKGSYINGKQDGLWIENNMWINDKQINFYL